MTLTQMAEISGAILTVVGAVGFFYRKIKKEIDALKAVASWTTKQQQDIIANHERVQLLIRAVRACLDGLEQQKCNGAVSRMAKEMDDYIYTHIGEIKSGFGGVGDAK